MHIRREAIITKVGWNDRSRIIAAIDSGSRRWSPKRFNPRSWDLIIAIVNNLHSGIIRFEVSHYQKARGLASSLIKAFKRTAENFEDLLVGVSPLSAIHRSVPHHLVMVLWGERSWAWSRQRGKKRRNGKKKRNSGGGRRGKALNRSVLRFKCCGSTKRAK